MSSLLVALSVDSRKYRKYTLYFFSHEKNSKREKTSESSGTKGKRSSSDQRESDMNDMGLVCKALGMSIILQFVENLSYSHFVKKIDTKMEYNFK